MIRSYLYVPASRPDLLAKAVAGPSDALVIDLEDAVAAEDKSTARLNVARFFDEAPEAAMAKPVFVRINGTEMGFEDIDAFGKAPIAGIRLPKAENPDFVARISAALDEHDARRGVVSAPTVIECLIESALGLVSMKELSASSSRISRFGIGAGDFVADIGARTSSERSETQYARGHLVVMSRVLGLGAPVAHVFTPIRDLEALERACREDAALGFGSRSCIHPSHVPVINQAFGYPEADLEHFRQIVAAYESPNHINRGAFVMNDGTFVDLAIYRRARAVVGGTAKEDGALS